VRTSRKGMVEEAGKSWLFGNPYHNLNTNWLELQALLDYPLIAEIK
jgi:hypothetical protein